MTVKMRAMANRTDLMRAILFGAPPVTLAIFKLANCCFCCSRADLSSVLDCDRRSDVFTWDPVVEIQKENCCVSTKELFLRDEGNFEHKRGKRDTRPPQSQSLNEYHLNHHPFIHQHPPWKLRIVVYPRRERQFLSFFLPLFGAANPKCSCERKMRARGFTTDASFCIHRAGEIRTTRDAIESTNTDETTLLKERHQLTCHISLL